MPRASSLIAHILYIYVYLHTKSVISQEAKSDVITVGFWYLVLVSCHKYSTETPQYTRPAFTLSIISCVPFHDVAHLTDSPLDKKKSRCCSSDVKKSYSRSADVKVVIVKLRFYDNVSTVCEGEKETQSVCLNSTVYL